MATTLPPTLKLRRLEHGTDLPLPTYTTEGAAGMDISAAVDEVLLPGATVVIPTGFEVEIPSGHELQIRSRSGLAAKHGVSVLNSPGTIDEDYRGELFIILHNSGYTGFKINRGDRIAQLVLGPVTRATVEEVDNLSITVRARGGLGSTGR